MTTVPVNVSEPWKPSVSDGVALLLIAPVLGWSYASNIVGIVDRWIRDPNQSFGFLVVPIALMIFWSRRHKLDRAKMKPSAIGFGLLLAVLALRYPLYEWNEQYIENATFPLVIACLTLAVGGWHLFKVAWPALAFLLFMLPLPPSINSILADPLQRVATLGSITVLQVMNLPVFAEGNVIIIGAEPLEVAQACNGLSMLLSFITLITAMVILIPRPLWERITLMLSAIPIALIANIIRIVATAWCYHKFGHETGEKIAHDMAGLVMPVIALALAFLELRILSWLVVEEPLAPAPARTTGPRIVGTNPR
ncbi:exosortase/archaeosortase family protein [Singulisphaera sp. PoT]|uniref:exosortase/archaeosortase family protein n=1 Tax=Singulisphaera sp. PoT TaxID=3411797 RepID=UPI003BF48390